MLSSVTNNRKPRLVVGRPCLDFVNTVDPRVGTMRREYLSDYASLVEWSELAGVINKTQRGALAEQAVCEKGEAQRVFLRAKSFREALYKLASAQARQRQAPAAAMKRIIRAIRQAWRHVDLVRLRHRYAVKATEDLDLPLSLLALDAERLITSNALASIRMCDAKECGWVFLDTSQGPRRRWCSMAVCGNREKARRFALRRRQMDEGHQKTSTNR